MTDIVIPEDVKQFLLKNIDSIAQWESLLLMRANPQKEWSAAMLAQNIYTSEQEMAHLLAQLVARDMLVAVGTQPILYRYQSKPPALEQMIGRAAELYKQYLIPITHIIHSKPKNHMQEFADAFKIRKD